MFEGFEEGFVSCYFSQTLCILPGQSSCSWVWDGTLYFIVEEEEELCILVGEGI